MLQKAVLRGQFMCVVCVVEGCVCDGVVGVMGECVAEVLTIFTMLCWFLLYSKVTIPQGYSDTDICSFSHSFPLWFTIGQRI